MRNLKTYECHRSAIALFVRFLAVLLPLTLAYIVTVRIMSSASPVTAERVGTITLCYRIVVVGLIPEMIRLYYNDLYVFGHSRIIRFRGRISLRYGRIAIAFKDIRDVGIKQTLLGRLLNYGTVIFGTASKDNYEVTMADLPHPHRFASMIQDHIHKKRKESALLEASQDAEELTRQEETKAIAYSPLSS